MVTFADLDPESGVGFACLDLGSEDTDTDRLEDTVAEADDTGVRLLNGRGGRRVMLSLVQTMEPTWTVFVDSRLGVVLLNESPSVPDPSAFLKGVHVSESSGTFFAPTRYRVETSASAEVLLYVLVRDTSMVVFVRSVPAPPWLASIMIIACWSDERADEAQVEATRAVAAITALPSMFVEPLRMY